MSNWTQILTADLEPDIAASAEAKSAGSTAAAIAEAVAAVRGAIVTGNAMDADPTKVPNSLKKITARRAQFNLMVDVLMMDLSTSQQKMRDSDDSWLKRYQDNKTRFEEPDSPSPAGTAEFQQSATVQAVGVQRKRNTRGSLSGL